VEELLALAVQLTGIVKEERSVVVKAQRNAAGFHSGKDLAVRLVATSE